MSIVTRLTRYIHFGRLIALWCAPFLVVVQVVNAQGIGSGPREIIGLPYGEPTELRPMQAGVEDSLVITTSRSCGDLTIDIRRADSSALGILSMRIDNPSNTKILRVEPFPFADSTAARLTVVPVDRKVDASGLIAFRDRTGSDHSVPYMHIADRIAVLPSQSIEFGKMTPDVQLTREVKVTNPLPREISIWSIRTISDDSTFSILSPPADSFPLTLARGESVTLVVAANPAKAGKLYVDTFRVRVDCSVFRIPVEADTRTQTSDAQSMPAGVNSLLQNEPNPFSGNTAIAFSLARAGHVTVEVFNVSGQNVATVIDGLLPDGRHRLLFNSAGHPRGAYYVRITSGDWTATRSMVIR